MSWNELFKSTIISQYYDSQAEGREFESRFPLRQKRVAKAALLLSGLTDTDLSGEERTDNKRRPRQWPFLSDGIPIRDLVPTGAKSRFPLRQMRVPF